MAGRKPKPDALKIAQGNPGNRPLATEKSTAAAEADQNLPSIGGVPKYLSKEGAAIWRELVPQLDRVRFVKSTDRGLLARYCDLVADYWKATRRIRRAGHSYESNSNHGKLRRINPDFQVQMRLQRELMNMEDRIGLSPQARQKIMQDLAAAVPTDLFPNGENRNNPAGPGTGGDVDSAVGILVTGSPLH